MMTRSTTRSKQRSDTLMQDHICRIDKNLLQRTAGPYIWVSRMQRHRHDRSVDLHLVKPSPRLPRVLAAIEPAVVARGGDAERRIDGLRVLRRHPHIAPVGDRREPLHLHVLPAPAAVGGAEQAHA